MPYTRPVVSVDVLLLKLLSTVSVLSTNMESDTLTTVHSFQCQFCEEVFSSSIQMAQHWQDHHQEDHIEQEVPVYQLLQTSPFALTNGVSGVRDVTKESDCITAIRQHSSEGCLLRHEDCGAKLGTEMSPQRHVLNNAPESSNEITLPKISPESKTVVTRRTKDFCCEICGKTYTTTSNLNKHSRTHTGVLYTCSYCRKGFRYKESLKKHEKSHLHKKSRKGDHGYRCQYCHKIFSDKLRLSVHFRSHPLEKTYKCDHCERTFLYKSGLKRHILSHASVKEHICPHCQRSFLTVHSLKAHIKTHSDKRAFSCDKCGKAFAQKLTLKEHMQLHKDTKSYKCSYCGKGFRQRSTLWGHEKIHKREKVHKCSKCDDHFGTLKDLRRHEKKHWMDSQQEIGNVDGDPVKDSSRTGRRFECDRCGEVFTQKVVLQTHYRRHTGEMPFVCEVCGKRFRHLASHKRHALIHKGVKKYQCDACGKSFTKKSYLEWHVSKPHSNLNHSKEARGCSHEKTPEATDCLSSAEQNQETWDNDQGRVLPLEPYDGSECESEPPTENSACESETGGNLNSDSTNNSGNFTSPDNLDLEGNHNNRKIYQVGTLNTVGTGNDSLDTSVDQDTCNPMIEHRENLHTPESQIPQAIEETSVIVSFEDVCDVPINEECVHTMNVLDHVMQLAQISQRDLQESQIQMEDNPLGQEIPEDSSRNVVDHLKDRTLEHYKDDQTLNKQKSNAVKPFVCELCGRMYSSNSSLLRHKQTHLISKPHKCSFCEKSYSRGPLLREHILFSHSGQHRAHQCTFCQKSFPNATRLELHVRIHTQDKPFKCAVCQKGFTDSSNLRHHERSHKGLRTLKCLKCGQLFSEKPALQRHLARHQGEKVYQCQHCTKSFALKADLQSHSILHRAAKDSRCSLCGLIFQRQISFNLHQACTKKSARKCRICGYRCVNECTRRQHELNEHSFLVTDSGFTCGHCKKIFSVLGKTVSHIREHCEISRKIKDVPLTLADCNDVKGFRQ